MCERSTINKQQQKPEAYFNASFYSDEVRERYDPNYDVRPSTDVPVVTFEMPQSQKTMHACNWNVEVPFNKAIFLAKNFVVF